MKFTKPDSVSTCIYFMKQADVIRSSNRALINDLFNGNPPFTDAEQEENNINTNVNFLDASKIAHDARNTLNNAFLKPGNCFVVTTDKGPVHKRGTISRNITKNINKIIKGSKSFMEANRAESAQMVLHGIGPSIWNPNEWCPMPVSLDDLLIPSRTRVSLDNLEYFAVLRQYTPSKFYQMALSGKNKAWDQKLAKKIWKEYVDKSAPSFNQLNAYWTPEKLAEAVKEDTGVFDSDAVPTINLWDFFHKEEESENETWTRKMVEDMNDFPSPDAGFIYQKKDYAKNLSEILHIMFADGANVAPFRYHSVRGLGWLLYAVCHLQNRLRCKFNDAVFENMLWYFRVTNPQDQERLNKVDLHHLGVIPDGLSWVNSNERHKIDQGLFTEAFTINRQTMAEGAAAFRSDPSDGTQKETTATEIMARVNAANSLVGSMLNLSYNYKTFQYQEICRRFTSDSSNPDVKRFKELCKKDQVPEECLDIDSWQIEAERVLGSGNKTLEIAQANQLMSARNLYDPEPQREILHIFTEAMTDNPQLADRLVPMNEKKISDSIHDAQLVAGTLMLGFPVALKTGMNHIEYVEALLFSMGKKIDQINSTDKMGTQLELNGLNNIAQHIVQHIEIIAQDKNEKGRVKTYMDSLGKMGNAIKGFGQRLQEKMAADGQQQLDPQTMADIQGKVMLAQTNAKIKEATAQQRLVQKQMSFDQKQAQSAQGHQQALVQKGMQTQADIEAMDATTAADIALKTAQQTA